MKYTKEFLNPIVNDCNSTGQVLRRLGLKPNGGTYRHISKAIKRLNLSTEHFNKFQFPKATKILTADEILILHDKDHRTKAHQLRRALLEIGIPHVCANCGIGPIWNNKPLILQVEHKDGNGNDDRRENLEFLCPNCHTQTKSWGAQKNTEPPENCVSCGAPLKFKRSKSKKCHSCSIRSISRVRTTKISWPSKEDLEKMVQNDPLTAIAKKLGVSDNSVSSWCRKYGIKKA